MDNEAPNYASWIPEAGGYVANGKVVSKSPIYNENGKLKLDVDTSVFGNALQPQTQKAQPQSQGVQPTAHPEVAVSNNPLSGMTTANTAGSGKDVNSLMTGAGSLGSLNNNTENSIYGATNTPATKSNVAGKTVLSPIDEAMQEYQDAVARGTDIQAEINALTKLSRLTGEDYSEEIAALTKKRQNKIQSIDNSYLQKLNTAKQNLENLRDMYNITGSKEDGLAYLQALEEYEALQQEQGDWRNTVGYENAMREKYQQEMEDIQIQYEGTWIKLANDLTQQIVQAIPGLVNFQYDPTQDTNLLNAQAMIEMRARNRASQTGMYYSSTTQYAISQACAQLIPVYQKMAKQEALENLQLLQNTANFLMNLEQTQFDMWQSQIKLQWQQNDERRKDIDQAIENANARGYYTNEEAALLNIEPGTESQAARERAQEKQDEIQKELRKLDQDIVLAEAKAELDIYKTQEEAKVTDALNENKAYYDYYYDSLLSEQKYKQDVNLENIKTLNDANLENLKSQNNMAEAYNKAYYDFLFGKNSGNGTGSDSSLANLINKYGMTAYSNANEYIDNFDINGVGFDKADVSGNNQWVANEIVAGIQDYAKKSENPIEGNKVENQIELDGMTKMVLGQKTDEFINKYSDLYYGPDETDTATGISKSMSSIHNLVNAMSTQGTDEKTRDDTALAMYQTLFQSIQEYGDGDGNDDNFDYVGQARNSNKVVNIQDIGGAVGAKTTYFNQGTKAKEDAMIAIIGDIYAYEDYPYELKNMLVKQLSNNAYEFAKKHDDGYSGLEKEGNWSLINGYEEPEKKTGMTPEEFIKMYQNSATPINTNTKYAGDRI